MAKKKYKFKNENARRKNILGYSFMSPWIIGSVLLTFIPFLIAIYMSFSDVKHDVHGYHFSWAGFKNFVNALTQNVTFLEAIWDFMKTEIVYVPIILVISFILALILNKNIKGRGFFRTIYFMPVIIMSGALISLLFETTTATDNIIEGPEQTSFLFRILSSYSLGLANAVQAIFDEFVVILWLTGIPIILFINALQKISKDLYAAAQIDGASSWQCLWKITIPNVRSTAMILAVFSIVQVGTLPTSTLYSTMEGQMNASSDTLGLAAAMAFIMTIFILLMIGIFALILLPRKKVSKEVITFTQNVGRKEARARMEKQLRSVQTAQKRQMKALRRAQLDYEEEVAIRKKKMEKEKERFERKHENVSEEGK